MENNQISIDLSNNEISDISLSPPAPSISLGYFSTWYLNKYFNVTLSSSLSDSFTESVIFV